MIILVLTNHRIEGLASHLALQQVLHEGMHMRILVLHVTGYLCSILIIEFEYQHGNLVRGRAVYSLQKFPTDIRQTEINEISVRVFQITHQAGQVNLLHHLVDVRMSCILHIVHNRQEGRHVHTCSLTGLANCLISKTQGDAKTTQHLQHAVIIADDIAHRVQFMILLCHCFIVFLPQSYNKVHNQPLFLVIRLIREVQNHQN